MLEDCSANTGIMLSQMENKFIFPVQAEVISLCNQPTCYVMDFVRGVAFQLLVCLH